MMRNPPKGRPEILDIIRPWIIIGKREGDPPTLKPDAPEEIKELFKKWLSMM